MGRSGNVPFPPASCFSHLTLMSLIFPRKWQEHATGRRKMSRWIPRSSVHASRRTLLYF